MHEREEGGGLTEDGSGGGAGGSGGERCGGISADGEGGSCGKGGSGGVDGARLWWLWGRRRRQETVAKWGDGESGRRRRGGSRDLGEKWWPGGNGFLVKSNLAVARLVKHAIAKIAIAFFTKRAAAIAM